jgi:hypothetical protein
MAFHFHNDVSAVYYSDDGEVILGDQGRYSYTKSLMRNYFVSVAAHNVATPAKYLEKPLSLQFANKVWVKPKGGDVEFGVNTFGRQAERTLEIPATEDRFVVTDRIMGDNDFVTLWNVGPDVESIVRFSTPSTHKQKNFEWRLTTKRKHQFSIRVSVKGSSLPMKESVSIVRGTRTPWLGWYATGHEAMEASRVLRIDIKPLGLATVTTTVERVR